MACPHCGSAEPPMRIMTADGKRSSCSACFAMLAEPEAPVSVAAVTAPAPVKAAPKAKRIAAEPLDVLRAARARLRFVNAEIKKLRKLETERAQLIRLLDAADGKPAAVVPLKRSQG